jgi:hypothetical protein
LGAVVVDVVPVPATVAAAWATGVVVVDFGAVVVVDFGTVVVVAFGMLALLTVVVVVVVLATVVVGALAMVVVVDFGAVVVVDLGAVVVEGTVAGTVVTGVPLVAAAAVADPRTTLRPMAKRQVDRATLALGPR